MSSISHAANLVNDPTISLTTADVPTIINTPITANSTLFAQIVPDSTLGDESSVLSSDTSFKDTSINLIDGGAVRGSNLFHSFREFTLDAGQHIYFSNPSGIENILSRVTGNSISYIDGLLGVNGNANLFFLNPNGIIFGPSAELDISGSFNASTANSFVFSDNSEFGTNISENQSLLSISAPSGVQFNEQLQGDIVSAGKLEVGQSLILSGNQLYLEGQLAAERDLTLQAQNTITIRDTATHAFSAQARQNLTIQGKQGIDILALQHPEQSPFVSGGALSLLSDGVISADAHFDSGGALQILTLEGTPGNVVSLYDPIIFADGNVVFGDYTGVALKIEATGSIQAGNIVITGPDTTLTADGSGSDEDLLASSRAVILRAGIDSITSPTTLQVFSGTTFTSNPNSDLSSGSILVGSINTSDRNSGEGGPIILTAYGDITTTTPFVGPRGNLISLGSFSFLEGLGNPTDDGNGGNISLSSTHGNITINGSVVSSSLSIAPSPPEVAVPEPVSDNSSSLSESCLNECAQEDALSVGYLEKDTIVTASFFPGDCFSECGGDINISSGLGDITINGNVNSSSFVFTPGSGGSGGEISVTSDEGNIAINGSVNSFAASQTPQSLPLPETFSSGGGILLSTGTGNISINGNVNSSAYTRPLVSEDIGNGGNITFLANNGNIFGNNSTIATISQQLSSREQPQRSGLVTLAANTISDIEVFTISNFGESSDIKVLGIGDNLVLNNVQLTTGVQFNLPDPSNLEQTISIPLGEFSQPGDIFISSAGNLILNNTETRSDTLSSNLAGSVNIESPRQVILNNSRINSNANISGPAGNIEINSGEGITVQGLTENGDSSGIFARTLGSGSGGNVILNTPLLSLDGTSEISASTESIGFGGSLTVQSLAPLKIQGPGRLSVESEGLSSGGSGNLNVVAPSVTLDNGITISASTESQKGGGNIIFDVDDVFALRRGSFVNTEATNSAEGNAGNIFIESGFVLAVPNENADIVANAIGGSGGRIDITSNQLLGLTEQSEFTTSQLRLNESSDISASSQFGQQGSVALNNIEPDPAQGLSELPRNLLASTDQISEGCSANIEPSSQSEFVTTGRGGIPSRPGEALSSQNTEVPWVTLPSEIASSESSASLASSLPSSSSQSLVEAQGWVTQPDGQVFFVDESYKNTDLQVSNISGTGHCSTSTSSKALH